MAQEEPLARLTLEDISVDEEGRVIVTNPQIAERMKAAAKEEMAGMSGNYKCTINTVKNCGCRATKETA